MTKFKIKDYTSYGVYWDIDKKTIYKYRYGNDKSTFSVFLSILPAYQIEAFESFLTHNPKAKNLTLESAKELLKTFLDNQKH